MLEPLNKYIATLNERDQRGIFEAYGNILDAFNTVKDRKRLASKLAVQINVIYDHLDVTKMLSWLTFHLTVNDMESNEQYSPDDGPRELTYIRSEYRGLVRLGVVLKPLLPIISMYMTSIAPIVGTSFKEYQAIKLVDSRIMATEEWQRLRVYVEITSQYASKLNSAIMGTLGSVELPQWLLSYAVIRKVLISDPADDNENVVRKMYNYLKSKMDKLDNAFDNISDKRMPRDHGRAEDNVSCAEDTSIRQDIPRRVPTLTEYYITTHGADLATRLEPQIDITLVESCIRRCIAIKSPTNDIHRKLVGCIINPLFPARTVYLISNEAFSIVNGVTQAILEHWGYSYLAALLSAEYGPTTNEEFSMGGDSAPRSRVPKDISTTLKGLYPHYRRSNAKELNDKNNVGNEWIEELLHHIQDYAVTYSSTKRLATYSLNGTPANIPSDFRPTTANFLIQLDSYYQEHH